MDDSDSSYRGAILVTGATGVLGSSLVRTLCAAGHPVVAAYFQANAKAELLAEETGCSVVAADLRDEAEVERLLSTQPPGAVVHCAGYSRDTLLARTSADHWQATLELNLTTAFLVARGALNLLPPGGRLVLVSSRVGERGQPGQSAYAAAKGAVTGLMEAAAREGVGRGIAVNAVFPGFVPSALSEKLADEWIDRRRAENLIPNPDGAAAFTACVRWILECRIPITGQIFRPDCRI